MKILGIESSCDETSFAIYDDEQGLLCNIIHSQVAIHQQYGGVIPELSARNHIERLIPLLDEALKTANMALSDLDGIAFTTGPGLVGALMTGAVFARSLAFAIGKPAIGVHHLEAHLLAPMLEEEKPSFPFLALLVSGGHTQLIKVAEFGQYELLGETIDDAAGEAFDKTARLLGLPYPGGPALARLANQGRSGQFKFPRPLLDRPGFDFSFSGLKTSARNVIQGQTNLDTQTKADIACAFQEAVVETLVEKCKRALVHTQLKHVVIAGGVGANLLLRKNLKKTADGLNVNVYYPRISLCTDNGAMVAYAGYLRLKLGQHDSLSVKVRARWPMEELTVNQNF